MLTEEEKRRIRDEEEAAARALRREEERAARERAAAAYRAEVRAALRPFPSGRATRLLWPLVGTVLVVGALLTLPRPRPEAPDDAEGGVTTAFLAELCEADVNGRLNFAPLSFSDPREPDAVTSSADGKRWNGWVDGAGGRVDFSCEYTPATDSVHTELIGPGGHP